ncbi:Aste57867_9141 [Aphanomyces stellatus]|uniref:Aste57867_9141 protein n=1 Tax=Aphanomyces stellatus TaxID=120398 RepID=A0A485KM66_9STRA|nr:hypothetical protein As57867_009105 [Aphanomyces stellatus]VFT86025.1 Aste57867_9141 [Aphanomyces stellatus]
MMVDADDECCCGFIPCLCVSEAEALQAKKLSDLRTMLQTTTGPCDLCLMMPCLCDGDALEEEPEIPQEDPSKSSKRVLPIDAYGRVELLRNETDSSGTWIAAELEEILKPHQREGVEFLVQHVSNDQGCILADYMGLGKTLQLISTIHSYIVDGIPQHAKRTALVLCPTVCILNWSQEFQKWLSPASLQLCPIFQMETHNSYKSNTAARIQVLEEWKATGGVLIMGYEMFRLLLNPSRVISEPCLDVVTHVSTGVLQVADKKQQLVDRQLRQVMSLLCAPGPDLVALDEGHRIKDPASLLCMSLEKLATKKRIVLTGYPLQNSLSEYWCMVNFSRPGYLEAYEQFRARYEKPILDGDVEMSTKLTQLLAPVVLRRGRQLLNAHLPTKKEWIVHCHLSPLQRQMYLDFLDRDGMEKKQWDLFTAYATLLQIINHPDVVHNRMMNAMDDGTDDENEDTKSVAADDGWAPVLSTTKPKPKKRKRPETTPGSLDWAKPSLHADYETGVVHHSGKMTVLLQLIRERYTIQMLSESNLDGVNSKLAGDKVVVFSQSVTTLQCVGRFLAQEDEPVSERSTKAAPRTKKPAKRVSTTKSKAKPKGVNYLVIDGSLSSNKRMEYINTFSDKSSGVDVLLVSTRAGAEGINLHAANRLVLFDVSWNPSHDHQSMCRSHRIGQTKDVHVYRFVSHDTMEAKIYDQQVKKVGLSSNIVDSTAMQSTATTSSSFFAAPQEPLTSTTPHPLSGDAVLDKCLAQAGPWVPKYFEAISTGMDE